MSRKSGNVFDCFGVYKQGETAVRKYLGSYTGEFSTGQFVNDDLIAKISFPNGTFDHTDHILSYDELVLVKEISDLHSLINDQCEEIKELKAEEVI